MIRASFGRAVPLQGTRRWCAAGIGALAILALPPSLISQQTAGSPPVATVTFTLDFPQSNPAHYTIAVDANGHTRYQSTGKISEDSGEESYLAEFDISAANRERIFSWTKQAEYFAEKIDSGNRKLAFTGAKVLSYQDGRRSNTARYNYSSAAAVQELTALFQNMASTLEYGRRLAYFHRYQKLALDQELKQMETQARNNELSEIQSVVPVLQEIFADTSVINVVRARAKELIQMGSGATAGR
jgi:hypothetical protein